jgi:hypothetical protein
MEGACWLLSMYSTNQSNSSCWAGVKDSIGFDENGNSYQCKGKIFTSFLNEHKY